MDIRRIIALLMKNWLLIAVLTVIGGIALYVYSSIGMTEIYQAQATMIVNKSQYQVSEQNQYSYNDILLTQKLVKSYGIIMTSDTNVQLVRDELEAKGRLKGNVSVAELKSYISVAGIGETEVLRITVQHKDPEFAMDVANAILEVSPETIIRIIKAGSAEVIDTAKMPGSPVKPVVWQFGLLGVMLGLIASLIIVFIKDFFDNTFKTEEDIRNGLDLPVITSLPELQTGKAVNLVDDAPFDYKEAFKVLRTKIQYAGIGGKTKKICVTSSGPFEGKTTISVNLAITIAETGAKVLLIDGDLRKPKIHKMLSLPETPGLTTVLAGEDEFRFVVNNIENHDTLDVVTCGAIPKNPAELLGSQQMADFIDSVSDSYDYIIFDTSPVGLVADTAVLSKYLDGIIWVVSYGRTVIESAQFAKQTLDSVDAKILGTVFNSVKSDSYGNRTYYRKYGYKYGYKRRGYGYKYGYGSKGYGYGGYGKGYGYGYGKSGDESKRK